nr:MAG TPA: hypothetical protein [Bacteriophage sp.]
MKSLRVADWIMISGLLSAFFSMRGRRVRGEIPERCS